MKKLLVILLFLLPVHGAWTEIKALVCTSNIIQKKFSFFYIPERNVIIWLEKAKEVNIKKTKEQTIYFDFHGDFGGGVDTVSSKLFFTINTASGEFLLRKDSENNKDRQQTGRCE
jgi:hypothetical protein|tara:strand:- start:550 stop:894 length:345 start_codon:yes stop_codon:yes gene_type:complete